jgi:CheY-like chemotaxis protein
MGYRLLLADDSITIQKVVELVLTPEDFQIKAFNDGEEAMDKVATYKPHIILADIDMPKLTGYQLCERVKNNPATAHIPVILLAGAFEPFDEEQAKSVGADDFIIKPFESQELISKVKALVKDLPEEEPLTQETTTEEDPFATLGEFPTVTEETVEEEPASDITFTPDDFAVLQEEAEETKEEAPTFAEALSEAIHAQEEVSEEPSKKPLSIEAMAMPSKEEIIELFRDAIDKNLLSFIDEQFKNDLMASLREQVSEAVRAALPSITEQVVRDILSNTAEELRNSAVGILNRIVPETVNNLIEKEIKKITAEL